jgi:hypothetical protein
MTTLAHCLQELFSFLASQELSPPSRDVRVVEVPGVPELDIRGRLTFAKTSLHEPAEFEARFQEIMSSGFPWVNLSCYGVHEDHLIVGIELPRTEARTGATRPTSVNYSGPPASVVEQRWDIRPIAIIES